MYIYVYVCMYVYIYIYIYKLNCIKFEQNLRNGYAMLCVEKDAYVLMRNVRRSSLIRLIEIENDCQNFVWTLLMKKFFCGLCKLGFS